MRGFLLANNDFLALSKEGASVLVLGNKPNKTLTDADGAKRMIHSLTEVDYLKVESRNHIMFACQFYNDRQIRVQEQYVDGSGFTKFNDLFRVRIHEITLRELLLIQSIYYGDPDKTHQLVNDQPNPTLFLKVFLELATKPLVSYMAFDNQAIGSVLDMKNDKYFTEKYPVFYCWLEKPVSWKKITGAIMDKDGIGEPRKISTIDEALERNQIRSVTLIIAYITRFQNKWVYANLFHNNLVALLEKGVELTELFKSRVLLMPIKSAEWPSAHTNASKCLLPYSKSIFDLHTKSNYEEIFDGVLK